MSTFSTATNFPVGANPNSVVVGDFNKDGKPDIATSYNGPDYHNVSVLSIDRIDRFVRRS